MVTILAALLSGVAGALLLAGAGEAGTPVAPRAGEEIFSIDPGSLLEVTIRTRHRRVDVRRWTVSDTFMYSFEAPAGRTFQRCRANPNLDRALRRLTSLRVIRVLDETTAETLARHTSPSDWAELLLRDVTDLEPFRLRLLLPNNTRPELYARLLDSGWVVALDPALLEILRQSC